MHSSPAQQQRRRRDVAGEQRHQWHRRHAGDEFGIEAQQPAIVGHGQAPMQAGPVGAVFGDRGQRQHGGQKQRTRVAQARPEQREYQVAAPFRADRPGRIVPRPAVAEPPGVHEGEMLDQLVHAEAVRLARRLAEQQPGCEQEHEQADRRQVHRIDPRQPLEQEQARLRDSGAEAAMRIGEHDAGQDEEPVHAQIAVMDQLSGLAEHGCVMTLQIDVIDEHAQCEQRPTTGQIDDLLHENQVIPAPDAPRCRFA